MNEWRTKGRNMREECVKYILQVPSPDLRPVEERKNKYQVFVFILTKVLGFRRCNILNSETSCSHNMHPTVNAHYNNIILHDKSLCATKSHFGSPNITIQPNQQNQLFTLPGIEQDWRPYQDGRPRLSGIPRSWHRNKHIFANSVSARSSTWDESRKSVKIWLDSMRCTLAEISGSGCRQGLDVGSYDAV